MLNRLLIALNLLNGAIGRFAAGPKFLCEFGKVITAVLPRGCFELAAHWWKLLAQIVCGPCEPFQASFWMNQRPKPGCQVPSLAEEHQRHEAALAMPVNGRTKARLSKSVDSATATRRIPGLLFPTCPEPPSALQCGNASGNSAHPM